MAWAHHLSKRLGGDLGADLDVGYRIQKAGKREGLMGGWAMQGGAGR